MKLGDGLFLNTFRRVAEEYQSSGITFNDMIVDNTCENLFILLIVTVANHLTVPCNLSQGQVSSM